MNYLRVREYGTLDIPFTNSERSRLDLIPGKLLRVEEIIPQRPDVDGCVVRLVPEPRISR